MVESGLFQRRETEELGEKEGARERGAWESELLEELAEEAGLKKESHFNMTRETALKNAAERAGRLGNVEILIEEERRLEKIKRFLESKGERELMKVLTRKSVERHLLREFDEKTAEQRYQKFLEGLGRENPLGYRFEEAKRQLILEHAPFLERLRNRMQILNGVKQFLKAA